MSKKRIMGHSKVRGAVTPTPNKKHYPAHMGRKARFANVEDAILYLRDRKVKVDLVEHVVDIGKLVPGLKLMGAIDYLRTQHFSIVRE